MLFLKAEGMDGEFAGCSCSCAWPQEGVMELRAVAVVAGLVIL